jgi:dipeptidyl aminopeptidase/acylaminoacyl peptidase
MRLQCLSRRQLTISSASADSLLLYDKWRTAHKSVELHMFAKGGHGFGMRKQNLPTDHWIDRFTEWLDLQGWLK